MTAPDRSHVPEWLRNVPHDWDIALLRLVARVESGHTPSRNHPEYWVPEECTIPWFSLADIWQLREGRQKYLGDTKEKISPLGMANSAARLLPAGTVVLSRTASVGFSGIMPRSMATTQDFVNFVCGKRLLPDFLLWVLRGMHSELERLRMGSTHQTIYMPDLLQFRVPVIPLEMQRAIADFLDRKTAAIDALIEKKQRLIALLAEKRAVLIHRAVTNGLNSDVAMKESGAEWVGKVPVHWTLKFLKFACTLQRGFDLPTQDRRDGSVPIIAGGGVSGFHDTAAIEPPGVVTGRYGTVGEVHLINEPFWPLNTALYVKDFWGNSPAYIRYLLMASPVIAHSGKSAVPGVDRNDVHQIPVAIPPRSEQDAIVKWLDHALVTTQAIEHKLQTQLTRLTEYRQSLITAAVTGQLPIEASP